MNLSGKATSLASVSFFCHEPDETDVRLFSSPDQSLNSKSDNSGEQEEGRDQDVEERQGRECLRRLGATCIEEVMGHKCLQQTDLKSRPALTHVCGRSVNHLKGLMTDGSPQEQQRWEWRRSWKLFREREPVLLLG